MAATEEDPNVKPVYTLLETFANALGNITSADNVLRVLMTIIVHGPRERTFTLDQLHEIAETLENGQIPDLFNYIVQLDPHIISDITAKIQSDPSQIVQEHADEFAKLLLHPDDYFDYIVKSKATTTKLDEMAKNASISLVTRLLDSIIRSDIRDSELQKANLISKITIFKVGKSRGELIPAVVEQNMEITSILHDYFSTDEIKRLIDPLKYDNRKLEERDKDSWRKYYKPPMRALK